MDIKDINEIKLDYLSIDDYHELKQVMINAYSNMPDAYWAEKHVKKLIDIFPEGQVAIKIDGKLAGCALSIIINSAQLNVDHTYEEVTGNYSFQTHTIKGDTLYGIDVFIKPTYRGLRLGRRLYDYRKELCEKMNLRGIMFGGRMPNYYQHADRLAPKAYIEKVRSREIEDPVLNFQLANDFHVKKVVKNYLKGDKDSKEYAVILAWDNIYYEEPKKSAITNKTIVRLGLVQWQMRLYKGLNELMEQAEFFVDAVSGYRCDFALFPEFFNAPLMADYNHLSEPEAIRKLAEYTEKIRDEFSALAISYNINIITGSMPFMEEDHLYNVGFLCRRDGSIERYTKIHVTPDEAKVWGMKGGDKIQTFNTDCGKIGVLICYDVEFPELSRLMTLEGMNILFVPFLTDTQNGYSRVRHCAQARAIENECYVAVSGSVGNLPKVQNMDIQFAQSVVFTPCDFAFPTNGIKAEATPNSEMILVADVDLDLLKELNQFGSVRNLKDRRSDLYELHKKE
ncbi:MAG: bifunctional GNAT family N-acetyltransferase/carbon-nitrogen hydrolase family protein [Flavobacteriaceae bacterium]|nr:bifunctional GNAT family N-acetyltransferase/carbon-nitrogen hydrolase family protein [Flavobacteriaceae bacterium]